MDLDEDGGTYTEYRVTWFEPTCDKSKSGDLATVKPLYRIARAEGWAPVLERREVTVTPWEIDRNIFPEDSP